MNNENQIHIKIKGYLLEGDIISDIKLKDINKLNEVSTSELKGNSILFFWATWCPYSQDNIKMFNNYYEQIKKSGIDVYFINLDEEVSDLQKHVSKHNIKHPIYNSNEDIRREFKLQGISTTIFIKDNIVKKVNIEEIKEENLEKLIKFISIRVSHLLFIN